jgi:hypothetical protein
MLAITGIRAAAIPCLHSHLGPLGGEQECDLLAEIAAGAGDDRNLILAL